MHGYTLRDANIAVKNLIINSYNNKIDRLIIITGKGMRSKNEHDPYKSSKLSILKYSVPDYIQNEKELMDKIFVSLMVLMVLQSTDQRKLGLCTSIFFRTCPSNTAFARLVVSTSGSSGIS